MASFGAHDRPSSYEAADLPGQGYNCCCKMVSGSAHLSATPGDLHPGQHSNRAGSTLWLHSLLHHDCHRTYSSCVPKPGVGWSFQQDYYRSCNDRQDDTWITCGTISRYILMPDSSFIWVMPWACNLRSISQNQGGWDKQVLSEDLLSAGNRAPGLQPWTPHRRAG